MTTTLRIRRPDDFHVHLRQGDMLRAVLPPTALCYGRALIMPNLTPPVLTGEDAKKYEGVIREEAARMGAGRFQPLMTIKLVDSTRHHTIVEAKAAGVVAGKLYPEGVTTNSEDGVRDIHKLFPVFQSMEAEWMVLCLHGEVPGVFCMDREEEFLGTLETIARTFPHLRIVLEHVTTAAAVSAVKALPKNVAATITPHHLVLTLDDVVGDKLQPHHFCKPIAKREVDRVALIGAATSGNPKFFLGTDSALHARETKECASGCAGVFCAPVAMEVIAEVFEKAGCMERIEGFTSEFGAKFYGLPLNYDYVTLVRDKTAVPEYIELTLAGAVYENGLRPFRAGTTLNWLCQTE